MKLYLVLHVLEGGLFTGRIRIFNSLYRARKQLRTIREFFPNDHFIIEEETLQ